MTDELTRLREWNATLRENITHIAGQLVERTAECAELRGERDKAFDELLHSNRTIAVWQDLARGRGRTIDRLEYKLARYGGIHRGEQVALVLAGIAIASLVAGVW